MKKLNFLPMFLLIFSVIALLSCNNDDDNTNTRAPIEFSITPEDLVLQSGKSFNMLNIHLQPSDTWKIENSSNWITLETISGQGIAHISMEIAANTSAEDRSTTITVTSGTQTRTLKITQAGYIDPNAIVYEIAPDASNMSTLKSTELTAALGTGWNLGNTLDAVGGETAWGNPKATQELLNAVKAAGFKSVRIPVAWSKFTNETNFTIDPAWLKRVEEVVNYAINNDMYVVLNEHWDGGWMQPVSAQQNYVNNRLKLMWTQIARHFRNYDHHLIFAGTNEVMVTGDYGTPTSEYYTTQNSFNQTFVNAVRSTGGRNAYRFLTVQGFNTNIGHTVSFAQIPTDVTENRLLMEVHYYDPYDFTLNENSTITQWGSIATDPNATQTWANESFVDSQFQQMKTTFIDKGVGVILGEYGAISRTTIPDHAKYRNYYLKYVSQSARNHGLAPFYWDNGHAGNNGFALFDRTTGALIDSDALTAILK